MANRLIQTMRKLQKARAKTFCAFLTAGYPSLQATAKLVCIMEEEGVDVLEMGFPFSDPLADGPTIQYASEQALKNGVTIESVFRMIQNLRKKGSALPILFFTYFNPIFRYGVGRFITRAKRAGLDGVLVPDLPPEEEKAFQAGCRRHGLAQVFLITPTTGRERAKRIAAKSQGFIYYVSLRGVTGARKSLPGDVRSHLKTLKKITAKPILVGFGVATPDQAKKLSRLGDGVIVGSALIDRLKKAGGRSGPVTAYLRKMVRAVKRA